MSKVSRNLLILLAASILSILACNLPARVQPDTRGTMNAALTEVNATSYPTKAIATAEPITLAPTQTPEPGETATITIEASPSSPLPTAASVEDDVFAADLQRRGHELTSSSSTIGPRDFVYSAYLFINTKIDPVTDELRSDICWLAIYRLDGSGNSLLRSFTAPQYPKGSRYTFPVSCEAINWDAPSPDVTWGGDITPETRQLLGLSGHWSDINQNGLPEFAIYYQYCNQGCLDYGAVAVHFYEIKNTYQLVDITGDLPGVIHPWNIIHNRDPLDIWVYDPSIEYEPNIFIESSWIFGWGDSNYENLTSQHASEYKAQIDQIVADAQNEYGMAITEARPDFLEILALSNKAKLPSEQTLDVFLDVTNPTHWPGSDQIMNCWLQLARAYAQRDADAVRPFSIPPSPTTIEGPGFSDILEGIDQDKYDVSACK